MNNLEEVNKMFNYIESNIKNEKVITGGTNDTQPYGYFRSGLNTIYDYFSVIFTNKKTNDEKYKSSVDNLDKSCDCSKYKCNNDNNIDIDYEDHEDENVFESKIIESNSLNLDENISSEIQEQESTLLLKTSKIV
jgi:uncharacterized protein YneR